MRRFSTLRGPCQQTIEQTLQRIHNNTTNTFHIQNEQQQLKQTTQIIQDANILHHSLQYQNHLANKTKRTPTLYQALFKSSNKSPSSKSHISFDQVTAVTLNDEVLSEMISKQVTLNEQLTLQFDWRIEANRIRNLGVNTWTCSLRAGQANELIQIVDQNDCSTDSDFYITNDVIRNWQNVLGLPFSELTESEFIWLLSDLLTFPSDHSFDVLSKALSNHTGI